VNIWQSKPDLEVTARVLRGRDSIASQVIDEHSAPGDKIDISIMPTAEADPIQPQLYEYIDRAT